MSWLSQVSSVKRGWAIVIIIGFCSIPAVTPRLYASDEIQYFAHLRSLWFDQDLSFDNEYRYFHDRGIATAYGFEETFLELQTETGLRINFATIGPAILWMPFYAIADGTVRVMRAGGSSVAADGYSRPYLIAIAFGSAFLGFLAVCLSISAARRVLGRGFLSGLAVWFGTPLLFYMYLAPGMAHACSAFAVALFVTVWLKVRGDWSGGGLISLGAAAALMTMVREQDVFFIVGPAVDYIWSFVGVLRAGDRDRASELIGRLVVGTAMAIICYLPQVAAYLTLNGRIGPSPYVEDKMAWLSPYAASVLLSTEHGLLAWTPLVVAGLVGIGVLCTKSFPGTSFRELRRVGLCLFLMFAAQVYISGSLDSWTVAGAFGQRRFVGVTIILVIGLATLIKVTAEHWSRAMTFALVMVCIWWNLGLMVQFGAGLMDRQRLELTHNAYTTFVVVPKVIPVMAYRYFFDRTSFYQDPDRYDNSLPSRP